ncbi:MAG TPA: PQQ-dependent sugar dehydrogenase [Geminicoccaceae bacterium]|nr:PQQ-dependent sugar dehydrogenase [Geminicoccaceae bacterium]
MHSRRQFDLAAFPLLLVLCLASAAAAQAAAGLGTVELVADGLDEPSNLASPPDGRERIYVVDYHEAEIRVIADGRLLPQLFLDLSDRLIANPDIEDGVLSLAFSPRFPATPYVYVTFVDLQGDLVLSRFEVMPSGLEAIAASEQVLLTIPRYKPMHHCGHLAFGPRDGLLYLCVGDTQANGNIEPIAQDPDEPRGKILRLNVEPTMLAAPRLIAATMSAARYEILASGLRNPWRFAFDRATGDLYIPDVGRHAWEEINLMPAPIEPGANFGWPLAEGNECIEECGRSDLVWPVVEYPHDPDRCAVIGGAVYRGSAFPDWQGVFVFGDECSGEIWALRDAGGVTELRKLARTTLMPSALGTRFDGEILIADRRGGAVWRLLFPDIDGTGNPAEGRWVPAEQAMYEMIVAARRHGIGWAQERLGTILATRGWRLLEWLSPVRAAYRQVEESFLRLADELTRDRPSDAGDSRTAEQSASQTGLLPDTSIH